MLKIFEQDFAESGYRVVDLLREIAMSEAFSRIVPAPPSKQELAAPTEEIEILTVMN
jgi:hypothetical protein